MLPCPTSGGAHVAQTGRCSRNGSLGRGAFPDSKAGAPGSGVIPSFLGCVDYSDLLTHKKPCGRLTDRDRLEKKKELVPVWFKEGSLGHCPGFLASVGCPLAA